MANDERIYIVDDDNAVRRALTRLLKSSGFDVESFAKPEDFLNRARESPLRGCILLDVRMPGIDGLEVQLHLNQLGISLPVILMTGGGDVSTAVRAMKAGAFDFLEKPFDDEQLIGAISTALQARKLADPHFQAQAAARRLAALSPRERDVLDGLVAGKPNKTIAGDLGLSVRTVEGHRIRMLERLGTHRLAEAIRLAVLAGLAPTGESEE